ncbi:ribonuclease H-like domain-containing protein [Durotheca rogersii]|uniref:ribonuclease H-like domain-containing protein n=1 Tax=Durotheca rogersii TaxID=419775 RepID=UPI00221FCD0C|nr:ribonuclease H-like domain-containing protein [Durotheca rogersii]KAI5867906.1 ribonuclease H-like domain-containing protein [Durotheca rogersii]
MPPSLSTAASVLPFPLSRRPLRPLLLKLLPSPLLSSLSPPVESVSQRPYHTAIERPAGAYTRESRDRRDADGPSSTSSGAVCLPWYYPGPAGFSGPVDEFNEPIERLFVPELSVMHRLIPPSQLVTFNSAKDLSQLLYVHPRTGAVQPDPMTAVVCIDGACRDNGRPTARAGWGVYFGPSSRYNAHGRVAADLPQTSSRAEIEALAQALKILREIAVADLTLQEFRIVSDSEYLVKVMTLWISSWVRNGGRRTDRSPVQHFETLRRLYKTIDEMYYDDLGALNVKFWHVPRKSNKGADALANRALNAERGGRG